MDDLVQTQKKTICEICYLCRVALISVISHWLHFAYNFLFIICLQLSSAKLCFIKPGIKGTLENATRGVFDPGKTI